MAQKSLLETGQVRPHMQITVLLSVQQILSYSYSFHRNRVQKIGQLSILSLQLGDKVFMLVVSTIGFLEGLTRK